MASILLLAMTTVFLTSPALSQSQPSSWATGLQCKFRLLKPRGSSAEPATEVALDYSSAPETPLEVEGIGPVPSRGSLHFVTRRATVTFLSPATHQPLATYVIADEISRAQAELLTLGSSPAQRLRRTEILLMLGQDSAAIQDLAVLASAPSLPKATRDFAAIQLGGAFDGVGNQDAAITQYARVAENSAPASRAEALVRLSDIQLSNGKQRDADRSLSLFDSVKNTPSASAYNVQAQVNESYLRAVKGSPATFALTTPLLADLSDPDDDPKEEDFQPLGGPILWRTVPSYPALIERLWMDVFKQPPEDFPCRTGLYCTATTYWDLRGGPVNGRFGRVAFRVSRWYAGQSASPKNLIKIDYAEEEEIDGVPGVWTSAKDESLKDAIRPILDDMVERLRVLGSAS